MAEHQLESKYRAPGKLLLTGEYLVLKGADALAIPTKPAQITSIATTDNPGVIHWETSDIGGLWFQALFDLQNDKILKTSNSRSAAFIFNLLLNIKK